MKSLMARLGAFAILVCSLAPLQAAPFSDASRTDASIVKRAYAKLSRFHRAGRLWDIDADSDAVNDGVTIRFDLANFHSGPLSEILATPHAQLVTQATGDVIATISRSRTTPSGEEQVAYDALWQHGDYATIGDRVWSVADILALEPQRYYDVSRYVSYDVTVRLDGRTRAYRALALVHDLYDKAEEPTFDFWDLVTGRGGALTAVALEQRPAYTTHDARRGATPATQAESVASTSAPMAARTSAPARSIAANGMSNWMRFGYEEHSDRSGGNHHAGAMFNTICAKTDSSTQHCGVTVSDVDVNDVRGAYQLTYHVGKPDFKDGSSDGPLGATITCQSSFGAGFMRCPAPYCSFSFSVGYGGTSVTSSAELIWSAANSVSNTCNLQKTSCGGTTPTGFQTNTDPNADCFSPILIDGSGDGYALTSAENGVSFDLSHDGVPEHTAWTAAGSDDAFLALDRNGNGVIDDGAELFGNFTAQPASDHPNGFLALAQLDLPANGGNGDGIVDARDAQFASLVLWRDANHDGRSTPDELQSLDAAGITALHIDYRISNRADDYGNAFQYRARIDRADGSTRWAWDVFFKSMH